MTYVTIKSDEAKRWLPAFLALDEFAADMGIEQYLSSDQAQALTDLKARLQLAAEALDNS